MAKVKISLEEIKEKYPKLHEVLSVLEAREVGPVLAELEDMLELATKKSLKHSRALTAARGFSPGGTVR